MNIPAAIIGSTSRALSVLLVVIAAPAAVAFAQQTPPAPPRVGFAMPKENAVPAWNRYMYLQLKTILLKSAERMPEEDYAFRPAAAVRSYGQLLGHIADAQYRFCSVALGEKAPEPKNEQTRTSKADLTAALKDAFAYCDKAYDGVTDASGSQTVRLFGNDAPRLGVLIVNTTHTTEHYGNLVTYMRMKNIVPPTSDPGSMARPKS